MGMGVYAGSNADKHLLYGVSLGGLSLYGAKLLLIIGNEAANALFKGKAHVLVGLVIAVEVCVLHGKSRRPSGEYLSAGYHVNAHLFLAHNAVNVLNAKGLARVKGQGSFSQLAGEGVFINAAVFSDALLVKQVKGSAVLCRKLHGIPV